MLIIDRFEGDWAVMEFEGATFNIPKKLLPARAVEGNAVKLILEIDDQTLIDRKRKIDKLLNELFREKE